MKRFFERLKAVVALLGLQAKFDSKELSAEDQAALIAAYDEANGENSFQTDMQAYKDELQQKADAEAQNKMFQELAAVLGKNSDTSAEGINQLLSAVRDLKDNVEKLGKQSQGDTPEAKVEVPVRAYGPHTDKYAFGVQHPMFDASKRYNKIAIQHSITGKPNENDRQTLMNDACSYAELLAARIGEHFNAGTLNAKTINGLIEGTVDYAAVSSDTEIGTRQFTIRQDALIARIITLPGVEHLFSRISNIQSGDVVTNVLFGEASQAYQAGRVFKGNVTFKPEKAIVDKVMTKLQFEDMSDLEKTYLNYLNTSGSDPVKWNLIEWIILQLATQINNERNQRAIMGYCIAPEKGKAGETLFASTGVIHKLISLYEEKKFLPFLSEEVADYSQEDIGNVLQLFAEQIADRRPDSDKFVIYVNARHKPWYSAWYKNTYGTHTDFKGVLEVVPDYNIPIRWVPNMGNLKLIFATIPGNINLLENVPGEQYKMMFQRDLEEVIAYSYWKEGVGVAFAGAQKDTLAELKAADAMEQMVFMNWPAETLAADATTISITKDSGILFTTGANSAATALTDITGAKEGVIYRIECGSTTNATTIAKSGKFSEIKSAWSPTAVGEYIKVYYKKSEDKFYEAARG